MEKSIQPEVLSTQVTLGCTKPTVKTNQHSIIWKWLWLFIFEDRNSELTVYLFCLYFSDSFSSSLSFCWQLRDVNSWSHWCFLVFSLSSQVSSTIFSLSVDFREHHYSIPRCCFLYIHPTWDVLRFLICKFISSITFGKQPFLQLSF